MQFEDRKFEFSSENPNIGKITIQREELCSVFPAIWIK
jgi:hypothetical protein